MAIIEVRGAAKFPDARTGYAPVFGGPAPMGAVAVKPLVPSRMSLPHKGACVDVAAFLSDCEKSSFLQPRHIRRRATPDAPRSRVHTNDWPGLLKTLDDSGMLMLARVEDVPRDGYGRVPRNDAFTLEEDEDWDLVIIARLLSNTLETSGKLAGSILPHGCLTTEKQLPRSAD